MNYMFNDLKPAMYNFVTQRYESVELDAMTADEIEAYIPQDRFGVNIFRIHLKMGKSPIDALGETLLVYVNAMNKKGGQS